MTACGKQCSAVHYVFRSTLYAHTVHNFLPRLRWSGAVKNLARLPVSRSVAVFMGGTPIPPLSRKTTLYLFFRARRLLTYFSFLLLFFGLPLSFLGEFGSFYTFLIVGKLIHSIKTILKLKYR